MKNPKSTSLEEFYKEISGNLDKGPESLLPPGISKEIGHFNVFDIFETLAEIRRKKVMPYNRRSYYKISLIRGRNHAEYADKVIEIKKQALLFATPKIPYNWINLDEKQSGSFCVFTDEFMDSNKSGIKIQDVPLFKSGSIPVFEINNEQAKEAEALFLKMKKEIDGDYEYKYDLLRNYVIELIHMGQKLRPLETLTQTHNAANRVTTLFIELLERQFPIESIHQKPDLRTAKDFADRLAIHVNHLNKVLKENLGHTTTEIIGARILQEAKILLKQTDWNISEIGYTLGFEDTAHFSNFFKKHSGMSPISFRE